MEGKGDSRICSEEKLTSLGFPQRVRKRGMVGKLVVREEQIERVVTSFCVWGSVKVIFSLLFSAAREALQCNFSLYKIRSTF